MTSDDVKAAIEHVKPKATITQPELTPPGPNERVVRTGGLKFILPMRWTPGDVLDEQSALLLNTAYHTAVINRFAPIRQELLSNPNTTYEDLDKALQAFFDEFNYTPRPLDSSKPTDRTDEVRELESFARPYFNKAVGGKGLPRADYEALLREWVAENREFLLKIKLQQEAAIASLTEDIEANLGSI